MENKPSATACHHNQQFFLMSAGCAVQEEAERSVMSPINIYV